RTPRALPLRRSHFVSSTTKWAPVSVPLPLHASGPIASDLPNALRPPLRAGSARDRPLRNRRLRPCELRPRFRPSAAGRATSAAARPPAADDRRSPVHFEAAAPAPPAAAVRAAPKTAADSPTSLCAAAPRQSPPRPDLKSTP